MMMRLAGICLAVAVLACGELVEADAPAGAIAGTIARVDTGGVNIKLLVHRGGSEDDRAFLYVRTQGGDAVVELRAPDGTVVAGGVADLVPGARIEATITGVELRSLPPQYFAIRVAIQP